MRPHVVRQLVRRGLSVVQVAMVLAVIGGATIVSIGSLGDHASSDLSVTAENVADPASLVRRFDGNECPDNGDNDHDGAGDCGDD